MNDLDRLPWFYKRYEAIAASRVRSPATCRPPRPRPSPCSRAPRTSLPPTSTCRSCPGCCTCPPGWCARRSGRTRPGCSAPRGRRAAASRSRCTSPCPRALGCLRACTGTTRSTMPSFGSDRRRAGERPPLVVTGVPWRTGWRYRERGFRHVYWDAGTMLSQLLAAADSAGLTAQLHTRFPDAAVTALVGADGVHEWPRGRRRARRGDARARRDRRGDDGRGRRGAGRVPARDEPRSGPAIATRSGRRGSAAPRSTCRSKEATRSRPSCWRAARSAAWTPPGACPRACCARR